MAKFKNDLAKYDKQYSFYEIENDTNLSGEKMFSGTLEKKQKKQKKCYPIK